MLIIKILLLTGLIRLLLVTQKPFLCSGIYAGLVFLFAVFGGSSVLGSIVASAIGLVLASAYFWLLDRFEEKPPIFWLIAVLGFVIGFV